MRRCRDVKERSVEQFSLRGSRAEAITRMEIFN